MSRNVEECYGVILSISLFFFFAECFLFFSVAECRRVLRNVSVFLSVSLCFLLFLRVS